MTLRVVFFCFGLSSWIDVPIWQNLSAEGSASSCSKHFLTGVGFEPKHTLVYQNCRLRTFLTLAPETARPSCLVYLDFFLYDLCFFNWVNFSIQRFNLLNGLCHPFGKTFVQTHVYFRVSHVFAGYLLSFSCIFKPLGYQPPNDVASCFFSFAFYCHLESTFQYDRICQLKALPHRVQNVFWQEWDSNPRTHLCTWSLRWGNSAVWCVRPVGFSCLGFVGHYAFKLRDFIF